MSNVRKKLTDIELNILYNQVNGCCPLCLEKLHFTKDGREQKLYEIAHIYPLNPTEAEASLLKDELKLFADDANDLRNLIALCPNCHTKLDKPTTVESYRRLYNLKSDLIKNGSITDIYANYTIEEEIIQIIDMMTNNLSEESESIEYDSLKVEEKIKSENRILINKVKNDVTVYYVMIKKLFSEMDKSSFGLFNIVAGQIKAFYTKVSTMTSNQNEIYEHIALWLQGKLKYGSLEAYKIIVSFFIQNCEVFTDVSK